MSEVDGLAQRLDRGLEMLQLSPTSKQRQLFLDYLHLLNKWNRAYNLSAVRDIDKMLTRHLLDSLSIVPFFQAEICADVGSGGGLPGIPLAINFPDRQFTLIDSNGKKTRFLFQAVKDLGLENVTIEQCRVEDKQSPPTFDGLVSRAFSTINAMLDSCSQFLAEGAQVYAMKGRYPTEELAEIGPHYELEAVHPLQIPNDNSERHLVVLRKQSSSTDAAQKMNTNNKH